MSPILLKHIVFGLVIATAGLLWFGVGGDGARLLATMMLGAALACHVAPALRFGLREPVRIPVRTDRRRERR